MINLFWLVNETRTELKRRRWFYCLVFFFGWIIGFRTSIFIVIAIDIALNCNWWRYESNQNNETKPKRQSLKKTKYRKRFFFFIYKKIQCTNINAHNIPTHYRSLGQSVHFCECFHIHRIVKAAIFYCLSLRWIVVNTFTHQFRRIHIHKRNHFHFRERLHARPIKCTHNFRFNSFIFLSLLLVAVSVCCRFGFLEFFASSHLVEMLDAKSKWPNERWQRLSEVRKEQLELMC